MLEDIFSGSALAGEYVFLLLCGAAAWMAGRAIAKDWKPLWNLAAAVLLLGAGARFLHFALYQATFISLSRYLLDTLLFAVVAYLGWRHTRTGQMVRQYYWLYERSSPLSWRTKG